jgi:hypothetical protein
MNQTSGFEATKRGVDGSWRHVPPGAIFKRVVNRRPTGLVKAEDGKQHQLLEFPKIFGHFVFLLQSGEIWQNLVVGGE